MAAYEQSGGLRPGEQHVGGDDEGRAVRCGGAAQSVVPAHALEVAGPGAGEGGGAREFGGRPGGSDVLEGDPSVVGEEPGAAGEVRGGRRVLGVDDGGVAVGAEEVALPVHAEAASLGLDAQAVDGTGGDRGGMGGEGDVAVHAVEAEPAEVRVGLDGVAAGAGGVGADEEGGDGVRVVDEDVGPEGGVVRLLGGDRPDAAPSGAAPVSPSGVGVQVPSPTGVQPRRSVVTDQVEGGPKVTVPPSVRRPTWPAVWRWSTAVRTCSPSTCTVRAGPSRVMSRVVPGPLPPVARVEPEARSRSSTWPLAGSRRTA